MQHGTDTSVNEPIHLRTELPWTMIIGLAILGVPRVVLHDLRLADGLLIPGLLAVVPPLVWVVVLDRRRVRQPLWAGVSIGAVFGLMLATTHQLLWSDAFAGEPPRLEGNLRTLEPGVAELVLRIGAFISSIVVGLAIGLACGVIVWALDRRRPHI
jgi:hypothetical protein